MSQVVVDIKKLQDVVCTCGGTEFVPVNNLKLLPPLLSPTMKQEFVTIGRWKCCDCGALVPLEFKK